MNEEERKEGKNDNPVDIMMSGKRLQWLLRTWPTPRRL
jgi:hypothetical protein